MNKNILSLCASAMLAGCATTGTGAYGIFYQKVSTNTNENHNAQLFVLEDLPESNTISKSEYHCLGYVDMYTFFDNNQYDTYGTTWENAKVLGDSLGADLILMARPYRLTEQETHMEKPKNVKFMGLCNEKLEEHTIDLDQDLNGDMHKYNTIDQLPNVSDIKYEPIYMKQGIYRFRAMFLEFRSYMTDSTGKWIGG